MFFGGDGVKFKGTAVIAREDAYFVATCLENNVASQGKSIEEALENLKEAVALFYEGETAPPRKNEHIYITTFET